MAVALCNCHYSNLLKLFQPQVFEPEYLVLPVVSSDIGTEDGFTKSKDELALKVFLRDSILCNVNIYTDWSRFAYVNQRGVATRKH
jgi:hypothetical protein